MDHSHYDLSSCAGYGYGQNQYKGKDHLYEIHAAHTTSDITIKVSKMSADLDLLLFRSCGDHYGQSGLDGCIDYSIASGHHSEEITIHNASGTYYLAVDSEDPWRTSGYEIAMTCHQSSSYSCDDAVWLTCGASKWSDAPSVNHLSGEDYQMNTCGGPYDDYIGYDHMYKVDLGTEEQHLEIDLTNLTADLDLMVFSACSPNYSQARMGGCAGYSHKTGNKSEHISMEHASGIYYIVVDAKSAWYQSEYKIKVHCTPYDDPSGGGNDDPPVGDDDPPIIDNPTTLSCGARYYGTTVGGTSSFDNDD